MAALIGIPSSKKDQNGFAAEEKAFNAARFWKGKGVIRNVRMTQKLGPEDMALKDLVLTLLDGREVMIQVKNHYNFLADKKCREEGIVFFIIWRNEDESVARKRMLALILNVYASDNLTPSQIRQIVMCLSPIKKNPLTRRLTDKVRSFFRRVR